MKPAQTLLSLAEPTCLGAILLMASISTAAVPEPATAPRSDASVLHVDFENFIDTGIGFLNAGVRFMGYPFTTTKQKVVTVVVDKDAAFAGTRCAYAFTDQKDQSGRIRLQRRVDNSNQTDEISEFVFRPVKDKPADLEGFLVWSGNQYQGGAVGVTILANGTASNGTYSLDIKDAEGMHNNVVKDLKQTQWIRVILDRQGGEKTVEVWVGAPDQEKMIGKYKDLNAGNDLERVDLGDISNNADNVLGSGYWDDVRVGKRLAKGGKLFPPEPRSDVSQEMPKIEYPIVVGKEKQLFVDDVVIQSQKGLKRTLHQVAKYPKNPILVSDKPWEDNSLMGMGVRQDPETKKWRMWYGAYRRGGKRAFECVADSDDGIKWTKPNLGLFEFKGSKDNNIFREGRVFGMRYDPEDSDPAKRYKAIIRDAGFLASYSPDGLHWNSTRQVLDQSYDATGVYWDPVGKKWIANCKISWDGRRVRGYAESRDFENWTDTRLMLTHDDKDGPKDQLYGQAVLRYESVYVGPIKIYHTDTDRCDVQLAFSRNAKHWERPDRTAFLPNSPTKGTWDYGNIDGGGFVRVGDELRFYYVGRSLLHNEKAKDGAMDDGKIGMATLRLDGFMSMDAGVEEGELTTQPVILKGKTLYLNADAKGGEIRVEILEADTALPDFQKDKCQAISSDTIRQAVAWNKGAGLDTLLDKPVRLKFYLKNAKLYSFWSE